MGSPLTGKIVTKPEWAVIDPIDSNAYIPGIDHSWWEFADYGKEWVAYLYRPTEKGGGTT